jgi:hypothetical protein
VRDWARWRTAPRVERALALVRACVDRDGEVVDLEQDGIRFQLERARRLDLCRASVDWLESPPTLLLRVPPDREWALAKHSWERVRLGEGQCGYDAVVVDERARIAPRMKAIILWGTMALTASDPTRLRELYAELTGASRAQPAPAPSR